MIRARAVRSAGTWFGTYADRISLAYDERHRRRFALQTEGGLVFLLDLPEARVLRQGDGLVLEDGRIVEVRAKPEPLLVVCAQDRHHLARLAWHLGNRHVPAAIEPGRILIRPDHVIAAMLVGLGAQVTAEEAPFDPESGAYAQVVAPDPPHEHPAGSGAHHGHS